MADLARFAASRHRCGRLGSRGRDVRCARPSCEPRPGSSLATRSTERASQTAPPSPSTLSDQRWSSRRRAGSTANRPRRWWRSRSRARWSRVQCRTGWLTWARSPAIRGTAIDGGLWIELSSNVDLGDLDRLNWCCPRWTSCHRERSRLNRRVNGGSRVVGPHLRWCPVQAAMAAVVSSFAAVAAGAVKRRSIVSSSAVVRRPRRRTTGVATLPVRRT